MEMIENVDYRLDHEKKILYMPKRLWDASYRNTEVYNFVWSWLKQDYDVQHGCSDNFIKTGKENGPFYWTCAPL